MIPMAIETKTVTAFQVLAVRRNSDGSKVLIVQTTYSDASVTKHDIPIQWSDKAI